MKETTRVFECWRRLFDVLAAATWPHHPTTGEVPLVIFGGTTDVPDECVIVVGTLALESDEAWATFGQPSQDETFALRVLVQTTVPGFSMLEVVARLEALCSVVERSLRDEVTGKPLGGFESSISGVLWHHVARVAPQAVVTTEGTGAIAEIDVAFRCRI